MSDKKHWMIYGANGFTGRLIAAEAKRQGLAPVLAGRSSGPVEALTRELSLPSRVFDLSDRAAARAALADVAVVANCAGPFSATSQRMIDACLATRTHYVDITGEIAVFVDAQRQHDVACARRRLLHALAVDGSALRRVAARIERDRDQLIVTGARTAAPETAIMDLPRAAPQRWRRPFDQSEQESWSPITPSTDPDVRLYRKFSLASRLPSIASAAAVPALFGDFAGTTQLSDFPRPCIIGLCP